MYHFRKGQRLGQMSARVLQRIERAAEQVLGLSFSDDFTVLRGPRSLKVGLARPPQPQQRQELTVAIVESIETGSESLRVRSVRYRDFPPRQDRPHCDDGLEPECRYEWAGNTFNAWPDFGQRAEDYLDFVWREERPKLETPWLRARHDRVWIVERPPAGGPVRYVIVRQIPEPLANWLWVQDVARKRDEQGWTGEIQAVGEPWACLVHPYSDAEDYTGLVWPPGDSPEAGWQDPLDRDAPIQAAVRDAAGAWSIPIYVRHTVRPLDPAIAFSDCLPELQNGA